MAKRAVHRRARKILGEEPVALVWCEIHKSIPTPPKGVHRAAGRGRLKPGHHWLLYVGAVVFFFVVVPMMLIDKLGTGRRDRSNARPSASASGRDRDRDRGQDPANHVFDGDWSLTAGQLLLRWYGHSPNPKRLVMLARERVCIATSPRRRLSPTKADDFRIVAEFPLDQARVEGEAGQPRGFATFRLRFADGSWLEVGRLGEPEDADHFLRTING
ncbi:hypothetical protein M271_49125 [Streptomyces rapamycinicus NRRL 5491]|uniref:Uncharacterized protein n=2 Tax=Streptomyces rapamycinicus TaxID=1226757 RepID=A0A0A0NNL0_STRRN|nr:hypothetical protein [Streptomyces rapamycinicus]AGP61187.1 hypothetical protein M271_49125 [Streptomyces rapamycinicus NRRL 5491]MBB4787635.1 hypothetical protein [Streptomyces rapamycinicus]RLV71977.1 hypothetical protein D3C57_145660 [Streptomyces rapamycinicus NRRL 5491]